MFKNNIQLEVCKALLKDSRVAGGRVNENEFAVTVDGTKLYVFSNNEIIFDTTKVSPLNVEKILEQHENDIEIIPTNNYVSNKGKLYREYNAPETDLFVYIANDEIKPFEGATLYANSPLARVLVKDHFSRIIGVVMPINYKKRAQQ